MIQRIVVTVLFLCLVLSTSGLAASPPSLTDYMQIYGKINNYVGTGEDLTVQVGTNEFSAFVKKDGTYGYNPTLKITGNSGEKLRFFIQDKELTSSEIYQNKMIKEINLTLNCLLSNKATWTCSWGNCVDKKKSAVCTCEGTSYNKTETCCEPNWANCTEWTACNNGKKTHTCIDLNKCSADSLKKTETESCGSKSTGCSAKWDCQDWSSCNSNLKKVRTCVDTNDCSSDKTEEIACSKCEESWICSNTWSTCVNGKQVRSCSDEHNCGTVLSKPITTRTCSVKQTVELTYLDEEIVSDELPVEKNSCVDGIKNQNEQKIDCGGVCEPCKVSSNLMYYVGGGIVLLIIVIVLLIVLVKRKSNVKIDVESIERLRRAYSGGESKGMSEDEITEKMVESGWDRKTLNTFLKQK